MTNSINIAVVGTGYWGKNLVRNLHDMGVLHTICDTNEAAARALLEQFPGPSCVDNVDDVLANPEVTGVVVAAPAAQHGRMVHDALTADKDVFVEKPLALSVDEGRALVELAEQRQKVLMVGHLLWYHPVVLRLKQLLASGELGRMQYIYSNRLNMGKLRREENVLWSFAPHDVSVILGLLGDEPESVQAQGGNYLHPQIADTTVTLLNFASGVRAHVFVSWLHPFKEQKLVIVGERKMAVFDDTAPWPEKLALYPHSVAWDGSVPVARKAEAEFVEVESSEPLRAECEHFCECIRTRARPRTDGHEGLRVLRVLNACQSALTCHGVVSVTGTVDDGVKVHPTAVVDADVSIGQGSRIWHFSHVLSNCRIGEACNIGQNVVIGPDVTVGDGCKIQNNVSVYKGVTLEDDVFCGPSMVFTNVLNPRSHVARKDEFKTTRVGKGATIGANATVVCGNDLGAYSFIGAGAVVTRSVPDHALMVGNPARRVGWMCTCGEKLDTSFACPCGRERYREGERGLETVDSSS